MEAIFAECCYSWNYSTFYTIYWRQQVITADSNKLQLYHFDSSYHTQCVLQYYFFLPDEISYKMWLQKYKTASPSTFASEPDGEICAQMPSY